ncbi:tRNA 2-selenouridine synthase [compost metagenome]
MCTLNKIGQQFAALPGVHAMTDVTGFGLAGHLLEMCEGSGVCASLDFKALPLLDEVDHYLNEGCVPGGTLRNHDSYGHKLDAMDDRTRNILCDPQTSGGLLVAVGQETEAEFLAIAEQAGLSLSPIGRLQARDGRALSRSSNECPAVCCPDGSDLSGGCAMSELPLETNLARIFLEDVPLIDLRAPVEFQEGAFPNAVSLPLMTDDERAQVGTCYKQQGQAAAIELGHKLVGGAVRAARIEGWLAQLRQQPDALLYCFRGGLRSQTVQQWLHEAGVTRPRVAGGYKELRRFLIDTQESASAQCHWHVLTGMTGSGKTHMLADIAQSVDLEGHAHHRGSSFGQLPGGQPSNINFENRLAIELLKRRHRGEHAFVVEDESRLIGRCALPLNLYEAMCQAPLVVVEVPQEERAEQIRVDYVQDLWQRYLEMHGGETGWPLFAGYLTDALARLKRRLGDKDHRELDGLMQAALKEQASTGDTALHLAWIRLLLTRYYDPMYLYQLNNKRERIQFRGDKQACLAYFAEQHARQTHQESPTC